VTRTEDLARALEAVRADTATDRVEAEGVRAAAQVEAVTSRTALADAQQRADTLTRELEDLRGSVRTLEGHIATLEHDRDARAAERAQPLVERPLPAPPPPAQSTPPAAAAIAHAPVAIATQVKSDVHRIAVVDDPATWKDIKLHGVETVLLSPTDDIAARLAETSADRVLVNLAARGAFDAALGARVAGVTIPFCGCLIPPGLTRGLALGFFEVARAPLDPDEITAVLAPFAQRGTRVLTAGADADAFISLRQALSRQGMSVSMAWDGKQASDLLQMVRPEIVILDLDIPPRSGLALIVELTGMPTMPVLVLLPGRQDLAKRTAAELGDSGLASRLLPPDRLLEEVRRGGKPKA
jgi:CheY-like chemotaxis protein